MNNTLVCIDVYTVAAGDTLFTIAENYNLPVSLLMKVNCITNPYNLLIGTKLCIPGDISQLPKPPAPAPAPPPVIPVPLPSVPSSPPPAVCPPARKVHVVAAGDTLYLIARMHGIRLDDIMNANPDIDPYNLMIGTELYIPM